MLAPTINRLQFSPSHHHSLRQEEIAALSGPDEFAEFYRRLKQVRTLHLLHHNRVDTDSLSLPPPSPLSFFPLLSLLSASSPSPSSFPAKGLPSQISFRRRGANADGVSEDGQREGKPTGRAAE